MIYKIDKPCKARCLECGAIMYGRNDRKFCCDSCKNHYHNKEATKLRLNILKVGGKLEKNYSILRGLIKNKISSIEIDKIKEMGYDFDFVTSFRKLKGHYEYKCYDIRYYQSAEKIYGIAKIALIFNEKYEFRDVFDY